MRGEVSLDAIGIKNVRSLKDTGMVSLAPVTLLLGENSSGKSTFLRTFPLLKQSICKRTDGPILWAGDVDDYVDFGSFEETLTNNGDENTIEFNFEFFIPGERYRSRFSIHRDIKTNFFFPSEYIKYSITVARKNNQEYISKVNIYVHKTNFRFELSSDSHVKKLMIDGVNIDLPKNSNLPQIDEQRPIIWYDISSVLGYRLNDCLAYVELFIDSYFYKYINKRRDDKMFYHLTILSYIRNIGELLVSKNLILQEARQYVKKHSDSQLINVIDHAYKIDNLSEDEQKTYSSACKLFFFCDYFSAIDSYLEAYFRQVHYIAPIRATAERYYRLRNFAIDEVDYQGKNLAIFLNGLPKHRLSDFQSWTQKYFGFKTKVDKDGGHLSVKIALSGTEQEINMSDTGFGYSQILPIITQLWELSTRPKKGKKNNVPLVIAIEQPELHLHPALQAKLTNAFIASIQLAKSNGYQLQLLLETHSETIVNSFGVAIAKGDLDEKDVSVVLFNKDISSNHTTLNVSKFDSDGFLTNWPVGFFAPKE